MRPHRDRPDPPAGPTRRDVTETLVAAGTWGVLSTAPMLSLAASVADLEMDAARTLGTLYRQNQVAEAIGRQARAILVFPKIVKAGLMVGGSYVLSFWLPVRRAGQLPCRAFYW